MLNYYYCAVCAWVFADCCICILDASCRKHRLKLNWLAHKHRLKQNWVVLNGCLYALEMLATFNCFAHRCTAGAWSGAHCSHICSDLVRSVCSIYDICSDLVHTCSIWYLFWSGAHLFYVISVLIWCTLVLYDISSDLVHTCSIWYQFWPGAHLFYMISVLIWCTLFVRICLLYVFTARTFSHRVLDTTPKLLGKSCRRLIWCTLFVRICLLYVFTARTFSHRVLDTTPKLLGKSSSTSRQWQCKSWCIIQNAGALFFF